MSRAQPRRALARLRSALRVARAGDRLRAAKQIGREAGVYRAIEALVFDQAAAVLFEWEPWEVVQA